MSRHVRRAGLPPASFTRADHVDASGLVVTVFAESGGIEGRFDFAALPGPGPLLTACAQGFARLAGPDASWRAGPTCQSGFKVIREFLRYLAGLEQPPGLAGQITPAVWAGWRLSRPDTVYGRTQLLITRQWLPKVDGVPAATLAVAARRIPVGPRPSEQSYTLAEYEQIRSAAARTFNQALVRIRAGREHLRRWRAGQYPSGSDGFLIGQALDSVLRTGRVPLVDPDGVQGRYERALGKPIPQQTWGRLLLTMPEAYATAVLLVCEQGWNRAVLDQMPVPDTAPGAGEDDLSVYRVEIYKRRRPVGRRYTSNNLLDDGPGSPGRLMRQVIEATEPGRVTAAGLGLPGDRLLVSRRGHTHRELGLLLLGVPNPMVMKRWVEQIGLAHPQTGQPLLVSLRRLRRTVQVLVRKEPIHNSQATHESVYVLPDAATRRQAEDVTTAGLDQAVEHARAVTGMRVMLHAGPQDLLDRFADPDTVQALLVGTLDTAVGACLDYRGGPFTPLGQPCAASFLHCLACPNAVATRRHLPRLVHLHQALDSLRAAAEPAVWERDWRVHYQRLSLLLEENTTDPERRSAACAVTDADQELIGRMLAGEYTT